MTQVPLSEAIQQLRDELREAIIEGADKDIVFISETRLTTTQNPEVWQRFEISKERLEYFCTALDALVLRCLKTLQSTPKEICRWLASSQKMIPSQRTFEVNGSLKRFGPHSESPI